MRRRWRRPKRSSRPRSPVSWLSVSFAFLLRQKLNAARHRRWGWRGSSVVRKPYWHQLRYCHHRCAVDELDEGKRLNGAWPSFQLDKTHNNDSLFLTLLSSVKIVLQTLQLRKYDASHVQHKAQTPTCAANWSLELRFVYSEAGGKLLTSPRRFTLPAHFSPQSWMGNPRRHSPQWHLNQVVLKMNCCKYGNMSTA